MVKASIRFIVFGIFITSCNPTLYFVVTDANFDQVNNEIFKKKLILLNHSMGDPQELIDIADIINKRIGLNLIKD